jgi:hypothetical protein
MAVALPSKSPAIPHPERLRRYSSRRKYPLIQSGDVHHLTSFLGTTIFTLEAPTLLEIRMAFNHIDGREVCIEAR